jgi:hypothetical protein
MDMSPAADTGRRATIEHLPEGLVVTMRVPRVGCVTLFLGFWLLGWVAGEVSGFTMLVSQISEPGFALGFAIVWLTGWTAGGLAALSFLALSIAGREIVTLTPQAMTRRIEAFGIGRTTSYVPQEVEGLRVVEDSRGGTPFFGFDYRGKTVRMGSGLSGDDAQRIVDALSRAGAVRSAARPPAG